MKDKNFKKVIYLLFSFVGILTIVKLGQFNAISYLFGMCNVYISRWCYRG